MKFLRAEQYFPIDLNQASKQTWPDDPECSYFQTHFLKPQRSSFVSLVSAGGSGNTWTRYMIEGMTGVFTGSAYRKVKLK